MFLGNVSFSQTQYSSTKELIKDADKLFASEKYIEALPLYSQLLSLDPRDFEYNYRYGVCLLYNNEDRDKSIKHLHYASQGSSITPDVFYFLGRAKHLNFKFSDAVSNYNKFLNSADKKSLARFDAERDIEMANNGKMLLRNIVNLIVVEKKEVREFDFFRSFDLTSIGGRILVTPQDLLSKYDVKSEERFLFHLPANTSDMVFFSSYGNKGENGRDLYRVKRLPGGNWGEPQKLPSTINTAYDDDYGFMHPNGREFFFASKGHNSMGGYDIFRSEYDPDTDTFFPPENMDFAINTPADDIFYIVDSLDNVAFFASNRSSEQGKLHIYKVRVDKDPIMIAVIKGTFLNQIFEADKNARIVVQDAEGNQNFGEFNSNKNDGGYFITLPRGGKYKFLVESDKSQLTHSGFVEIPKLKELRPLKQEILLVDKNGNEQLVIKNKFDEEFDVNDDVWIAMENLISQRAELNPNATEALLDDLERRRKQQKETELEDEFVPEPITDFDNKELLSIARRDVELIEKEMNEIKSNMDMAFSVAKFKNEEAKKLKDKAKSLRDEAAGITDEIDRERKINEAIRTEKQANKSAEDANSALGLGKHLEKNYLNKKQEGELAANYASALEKINESKNIEEALRQIEKIRDELEESRKSGVSSKDDLLVAQRNAVQKEKEVSKIRDEAEEFKKEERSLTNKIKSLNKQRDQEKKKETKQDIQAEIDVYEEQKAEIKEEIAQLFKRMEEVEREASRLRREADFMEKMLTGKLQDLLIEDESFYADTTPIDSDELEESISSYEFFQEDFQESDLVVDEGEFETKKQELLAQYSDFETSDFTQAELENNKQLAREYLDVLNKEVKSLKSQQGKFAGTDQGVLLSQKIDEIEQDKAVWENRLLELNQLDVVASEDFSGSEQDKTSGLLSQIDDDIAQLNKKILASNDENEKAELRKKVRDFERLKDKILGVSGTEIVLDSDDSELLIYETQFVEVENELARVAALDGRLQISERKILNEKLEREIYSVNQVIRNETNSDKLVQLDKIKEDLIALQVNNRRVIQDLEEEQVSDEEIVVSAEEIEKEIEKEYRSYAQFTIDDITSESSPAKSIVKRNELQSKIEKMEQDLSSLENLDKTSTNETRIRILRKTITEERRKLAAAEEQLSENLRTAIVTEFGYNESELTLGNQNPDLLNKFNEDIQMLEAKVETAASNEEREVFEKQLELLEQIRDEQEELVASSELDAESSATSIHQFVREATSKEVYFSDEATVNTMNTQLYEIESLVKEIEDLERQKSDSDNKGKKKLDKEIEKKREKLNHLNKNFNDFIASSNLKEFEKVSGENEAYFKQIAEVSGEEKRENYNGDLRKVDDLFNESVNLRNQARDMIGEERDLMMVRAAEKEHDAIKLLLKVNRRLESEFNTLSGLADQSSGEERQEGTQVSQRLVEEDKDDGTFLDIEQDEEDETEPIVEVVQDETEEEDTSKVDDIEEDIVADRQEDVLEDTSSEAKDIYSRDISSPLVPDVVEDERIAELFGLDEGQMDKISSNEEYSYYMNIKARAKKKMAEAQVEYERANTLKAEAVEKISQAKNKMNLFAEEEDPDLKRQYLDEAKQLNDEASKIYVTVRAMERVAENIEAEAKATDFEAELFLQSLDKQAYEELASFTGGVGEEKGDSLAISEQEDVAQAISSFERGVSEEKQGADEAEAQVGQEERVADGTKTITQEQEQPVAETIPDTRDRVIESTPTPVTQQPPVIVDLDEVVIYSGDYTRLRQNESVFKRVTVPVYSDAKPIPISPKLPEGLVYKVQVGAFRNPIPNSLFNEFAPVSAEPVGNGITRYTAGLFRNFNQADYAKNEIRGMGYSDAFVVAFYNGERISVARARELMRQGVVAETTLPVVDSGTSVTPQTSGTPATTQTPVMTPSVSQPGTTPVVTETITGQTTTYYDDPTAAPATQVENIQGLFYTVQVGVYSKPVRSSQLYNISPLNTERTSNGYIRYTTGRYSSVDEANSRKNQIVAQGISDAFVTAYYNGERISVARARQLQQEIGSGVTVPSVPEATQGPVTSIVAKAYSVDLGSYSGDIPEEIANTVLRNFGEGVERISQSDGSVKYLLGKFANRTDAERLRDRIQREENISVAKVVELE
jgi:epidermal growth factor receptor substrate 15